MVGLAGILPACRSTETPVESSIAMIAVESRATVEHPSAITSEHASAITSERVSAITSSDAILQRVSFEARHGGLVEAGVTDHLESLIESIREGGWDGPNVRVGVLGSEQPNAYVLISGHLYVTRGLLDVICSESELAAVVAHELAHFADLEAFYARGLTLSERLEIEANADETAVGLLLDACYDPSALSQIIAKLIDDQPQGWAEQRCDYLEDRLGRPAEGEHLE